MGRLFWIILVGSKWNHMSSYERLREICHRREGSVTIETEINVMWPQAKEC